MEKFKKQIRYDFFSGVIKEWKIYIFFCAILIFQLMIIYVERVSMYSNATCTWLDYISYFFLGSEKQGFIDKTEGFHLPFEWFFLQIFVLFSTAKYPQQDYEECGYQFWIRTGSKRNWWISKIVWCFTHVFVYYGLFYFVTFLFNFCLGGDNGWKITDIWGLHLEQTVNLKLFFILFIMPFIVSVSLCLFTILCTFCANSIFALVLDFVILISSAYWKSSLLIGNYTMLYRYFPLRTSGGLNLKFGVILCIFIGILSVILGYYFYDKKE